MVGARGLARPHRGRGAAGRQGDHGLADAVSDADRAAVDADRAALADLGLTEPPPVAASGDGRALLVNLPLPAGDAESGRLPGILDRARATVTGGLPAGLDARLTGPAASRADFTAASTSLDTTFLLATVGTVALLLLVIYRSPLLLLVPLLSVGLAAVLANAMVYLLGTRAGLTVTGSSATLLVVLVFGAGTDYALLLVALYRDELRRVDDPYSALAVALRRTLPTILASAGTVILAMLALLAADLTSTRGLGPVAAIGIGAALPAMATLLPALLVVFGRGVFWPFIPRPGTHSAPRDHPLWTRLAAAVGRHPRATWLSTATLLAALTAGVATLGVGGLTPADNFTRKPDSVRGQETLARHFAAGSGSPLDIYARAGTAAEVVAVARATPGIAEVSAPTRSRTGEWVHIPAVLADDPTGRAAQRTVTRLRDRLDRVDDAVLVGGAAARSLDQTETMSRDLRLVVPIALAVILLVLVLLLRAIVAPLLLLAAAVLSFGGTLGGAALVFTALGFPRTDPSLLLIGFVFLVALGVDYTMFLMSRVREEAARHGHSEGVRRGLALTGGVITSAGVVLAATFSVLTVTPVVLNLQIGLLVALGVLLDTLIVRTLLVPALVLDAGRRAWWPSGLSRSG